MGARSSNPLLRDIIPYTPVFDASPLFSSGPGMAMNRSNWYPVSLQMSSAKVLEKVNLWSRPLLVTPQMRLSFLHPPVEQTYVILIFLQKVIRSNVTYFCTLEHLAGFSGYAFSAVHYPPTEHLISIVSFTDIGKLPTGQFKTGTSTKPHW